MQNIQAYRRENLRNYIDNNGGPAAVAARMGYANASFLVQMTGPHPSRMVSERTAREAERLLGLAPMSLDAPTAVVPAARGRRAEPTMTGEQVYELIRLVGKVCSDEGVTLDTSKFADLVALSIHDARPEHIRRLVQLAK